MALDFGKLADITQKHIIPAITGNLFAGNHLGSLLKGLKIVDTEGITRYKNLIKYIDKKIDGKSTTRLK